ncbi:hypothetical protein Patl1_20668 [Pistacia atlantica]|uniref:Uncharacterized protein n=1 Tax=Pistacia atlantica TaxID=434234 RepID=A0ACC1BHV4_9ROSI|nr:hypothetical protein Patl1_20668 [Pistacia atlantica]
MLTATLKDLLFSLMILTKRSLVKNCYPTLIHSTGMCILHS